MTRGTTMTRVPAPTQPGKPISPESSSGSRVEIDTPTLITVSALAWAIANVCHEIIGHAGAAIALGIPVRAVSTTTAYVDWTAIESTSQDRLINAAATPVNVLTGAIALVALRWLQVNSAATRYFLWLFATVSFTMFHGAGRYNLSTDRDFLAATLKYRF